MKFLTYFIVLFSLSIHFCLAENLSKIEELIELAKSGDAVAQNKVGIMYFNGEGVQQNRTKAVKWFSKSAAQGNAEAQYLLGMMYYDGIEVQQNFVKAAELFIKADKQDYDSYYLGRMYINGEGFPQDFEKGAKYFTKNAEKGDPLSQLLLGEMYYYGKIIPRSENNPYEWYIRAELERKEFEKNSLGISQDYTKAFEWFNKAAKQGNEYAYLYLGIMYEKGKGIPKDYSKAFEWFNKAVKSEIDSSLAYIHLGNMFYEGKGINKDFPKALEYYNKVLDTQLEINDINAPDFYYNLATLYNFSAGVTPDCQEAIFWYCHSAEMGNEKAQGVVFLLESADLANCGLKKSKEWFNKALNLGENSDDPVIKYSLGVLFFEGLNVLKIPKNYSKAFEWFNKAAKQGERDAQNYIGMMYENGEGVPQDYAKAIEWYVKAGAQGHRSANISLGKIYDEGKYQDYKKAVKYYSQAIETYQDDCSSCIKRCSYSNLDTFAHAYASFRLGMMYKDGLGVAKSNAKAIKYFHGTHTYFPEASHILANFYYDTKDYSKAFEYLSESVQHGYCVDQYKLGVMYYNGEGVDKNYSKASKWLHISAENGYEDAIKFLKDHPVELKN